MGFMRISAINDKFNNLWGLGRSFAAEVDLIKVEVLSAVVAVEILNFPALDCWCFCHSFHLCGEQTWIFVLTDDIVTCFQIILQICLLYFAVSLCWFWDFNMIVLIACALCSAILAIYAGADLHVLWQSDLNCTIILTGVFKWFWKL